MELFGLVRITWLPSERNTRTAVPPELLPPEASAPPDDAPAPEPAPPPLPPPVVVSAFAPEPDMVRSLIGLADDLAELSGRDWTGQSATRTLQLVQRRVDRVLAECGVRAVYDEGPVRPDRHEVVGAQPVSADGEAGCIAATVRRGYVRGDELIRPQQVIAYVMAEPTPRVEGDNNAR